MTFDEAIDWCLAYNVEIDAFSEKIKNPGNNTILLYCQIDDMTGQAYRVVKVAENLLDAVKEMQIELGPNPCPGIFEK